MSDTETVEETKPKRKGPKKRKASPPTGVKRATRKKTTAKKATAKKTATKKATETKVEEPEAVEEPAAEDTTVSEDAAEPKAETNSKPGFLGFEEPPAKPTPNGATWKTRLPVLADHYEGEWVKYGPFSATMVKSSDTTCKKNAEKLGLTVETETAKKGDEGFLYVRVTS